MKKVSKFLTLILCSSILFAGCSPAKTPPASLSDFDPKGDLPVISVYTQDGVIPSNKVDYINASFEIENSPNDFKIDMKSEYGANNSVGIRLRGNSTLKMPKKPYRIKFDKKQSLMGLTANKNWVLLADYKDQSSIRNYSAFNFGKIFDNITYSPSANHVAFYMNGVYMGLYLLTEHVDEKEGRCNVDEEFDTATDTSFPFYAELSEDIYNNAIESFSTSYVPGEISFPDVDKRETDASEQIIYDYVSEYIQVVVDLLKNGDTQPLNFKGEPKTLEQMINVDSLIDFYLVNELMCNPDSTRKSIKICKKKDELLTFGPIWDFDWSLTTIWNYDPYLQSDIEKSRELTVIPNAPLVSELFKQDKYKDKFIERWQAKSAEVMNFIRNDLFNYKRVISDPAKYDSLYHYGETGDFQFDMQYDYVRLFLMEKTLFLNDYLKKATN